MAGLIRYKAIDDDGCHPNYALRRQADALVDIAHTLASIDESLKKLTDAYDPDSKCINVMLYVNTPDAAIKVQVEPGQYPLTIQGK